jgi:hypothetical protein
VKEVTGLAPVHTSKPVIVHCAKDCADKNATANKRVKICFIFSCLWGVINYLSINLSQELALVSGSTQNKYSSGKQLFWGLIPSDFYVRSNC